MVTRGPGHGLDATAGGALTLVGAVYFIGKPSLWKQVVCPILVSLLTTVVSMIVLFALALVPQVRLLRDFLGWPAWVAWISAVVAILAEVAITNVIVLLVLFGRVQSVIMFSVLEERGILRALREDRGSEELPEANCVRDFGHCLLFQGARLVLMIVTLPLHGVPVLGQIAWVLLNGWLYAWELEAEFMVTLEERRSCGQQLRFVRRRCGWFFGFGAAAMAWELVPLVGQWIFWGSNACAAALLAEQFFCEQFVRDGERWRRVAPPAAAQGAV